MTQAIKIRVHAQIKKAYYTFERYHNPSTFALLYHEKALTLEELAKYVRISDHFIALDEHHYFLIFSFTSANNSYKASQNLIHHLDNHFNNHNSAIALDSFDPTNSPHLVINRLQQILDQTRKTSFSRVEDETILESNF
jgi:tRNA A37 threonylcarbamoyladenosine synthetase subunit TsaC/SUA5/YrdC